MTRASCTERSFLFQFYENDLSTISSQFNTVSGTVCLHGEEIYCIRYDDLETILFCMLKKSVVNCTS